MMNKKDKDRFLKELLHEFAVFEKELLRQLPQRLGGNKTQK